MTSVLYVVCTLHYLIIVICTLHYLYIMSSVHNDMYDTFNLYTVCVLLLFLFVYFQWPVYTFSLSTCVCAHCVCVVFSDLCLPSVLQQHGGVESYRGVLLLYTVLFSVTCVCRVYCSSMAASSRIVVLYYCTLCCFQWPVSAECTAAAWRRRVVSWCFTTVHCVGFQWPVSAECTAAAWRRRVVSWCCTTVHCVVFSDLCLPSVLQQHGGGESYRGVLLLYTVLFSVTCVCRVYCSSMAASSCIVVFYYCTLCCFQWPVSAECTAATWWRWVVSWWCTTVHCVVFSDLCLPSVLQQHGGVESYRGVLLLYTVLFSVTCVCRVYCSSMAASSRIVVLYYCTLCCFQWPVSAECTAAAWRRRVVSWCCTTVHCVVFSDLCLPSVLQQHGGVESYRGVLLLYTVLFSVTCVCRVYCSSMAASSRIVVFYYCTLCCFQWPVSAECTAAAWRRRVVSWCCTTVHCVVFSDLCLPSVLQQHGGVESYRGVLLLYTVLFSVTCVCRVYCSSMAASSRIVVLYYCTLCCFQWPVSAECTAAAWRRRVVSWCFTTVHCVVFSDLCLPSVLQQHGGVESYRGDEWTERDRQEHAAHQAVRRVPRRLRLQRLT